VNRRNEGIGIISLVTALLILPEELFTLKDSNFAVSKGVPQTDVRNTLVDVCDVFVPNVPRALLDRHGILLNTMSPSFECGIVAQYDITLSIIRRR
jgi:hypothetical protein